MRSTAIESRRSGRVEVALVADTSLLTLGDMFRDDMRTSNNNLTTAAVYRCHHFSASSYPLALYRKKHVGSFFGKAFTVYDMATKFLCM